MLPAGDTLYSAVDAKPKRSATLRRIENARKRPDVTVLVDHYEEEWSRLWWIRLRGRARVLDEGEEATNRAPLSPAAPSWSTRNRPAHTATGAYLLDGDRETVCAVIDDVDTAPVSDRMRAFLLRAPPPPRSVDV